MMKEEKKQITEEEYQEILRRLNEIGAIKESLKLAVKVQKYKAHFPLAGNFEELLINLTRNNHEIDAKLNLVIKQFLNSITANKEIKKEIGMIITTQREMLEAKKEVQVTEMPAEFASITAHYPGFQQLYTTIQDEINKKHANNYLIEKVEILQSQFDTLLGKKIQYEKQNKGKTTQKRKIFSFIKQKKERKD